MSFAVLVDHHVRGDSFVHGLDPRAKLVTTLAFIFSAVLIPQGAWPVFFAHACFLAVALALSGLSLRLVLGRSILALPFVLAAVPVLFHRPGEALFEVPLTGWTATDAGLEALVSILLRSWLSVTAATILTATTEPDHILRSLRWLGVPRLLVATISFMWRYVFVIAEEGQRLLRARDARSAQPAGQVGGSLGWRAGVAGNMVGTLFLRSLNRSERVYTAMLARGYNGELKSLERFSLRAQDVAVVATAVTVLAVIQIYAHL